MVGLVIANPDMKVLGQTFFSLLLETSKDFSLRSVPREVTDAVPMPDGPPTLVRSQSSINRQV